MLDTFAQLVRSARTNRRYNAADPVSRETLIQLIDIARNVPSGMNAQPLRYRVVTELAEVAAIFEHTNWAKGLRTGPAPTPAERATGWIVILSHNPPLAPAIDVGIAAQTLQLGARAAGYAACMLLSIDRPRIAEILKLPADMKIELLMAFGRPGEQVVIDELTSPSQLPYSRTADNVHHVPKRKLADVLI
jgi:nitroreductase